MYLHLGDNISVRERDIIAICDYASFSAGKANFSMLQGSSLPIKTTATAQAKTPKAAIFTDKALYLSALSPLTLQGRGL